jgi:hypothetical protein
MSSKIFKIEKPYFKKGFIFVEWCLKIEKKSGKMFADNVAAGLAAGSLRGVALGPQLRYPVVLLPVLCVLRCDAAHQRVG